MKKTGRLELTWVGKYDEKIIEPRILLEDKSKSYGDPTSKNMLIHGDNLIALKALQQDFSGRIKCIYIDPPYNTGSAFEQYDDGLEHSIWLSMIRDRLVVLKELLSNEGTIWISIDDNEEAYLKVLCDEIFGRENFINTVIWQKIHSLKNDARYLSENHDFILVYAKDKESVQFNLLGRTESMNSRYKNPDNDIRGPWQSGDLVASEERTNGHFIVTSPITGKAFDVPSGKHWVYSEENLRIMVSEGRVWFGKNGDAFPRKKRYLSEVMRGRKGSTIWLSEEVGHNQEAKRESIKLFGKESSFATPKPERLIAQILTLGSNENDIILDSFLGSGTTIAVAQKMNRRWIGIEMGEQCYTHCKSRMDMVVDGEQGGISTSYNWQGGGGYHFYELAPSLLVKNDKLPVYQINPSYTFEMLCEAICKIEGFKYKPEDVFHGYSSEKRFIHITKEFVNAGYVKSLSARLANGQSLLIYGTKIQSDMILPDNIEVKKIPKDLLEKCDFESEAE
ncbi:MAG: site-specific DNA-methyltransferase [Clostridia bacterium]|jgi:adenine-specific DNA-methyltransferase|nr:site-specific DNA-methyltransferase [Clostridia bacterium]MCI2015573.1 site-specific DNA-methyltransferase [Clostridia bacterium]